MSKVTLPIDRVTIAATSLADPRPPVMRKITRLASYAPEIRATGSPIADIINVLSGKIDTAAYFNEELNYVQGMVIGKICKEIGCYFRDAEGKPFETFSVSDDKHVSAICVSDAAKASKILKAISK